MEQSRPYTIIERNDSGPAETLCSGVGDTRTILTTLRSKVFDMANSGKYGVYPDDIESFNEDIEEGFSDNGMSWEAKDGTIVEAIIH